jgi:hypothetical protein
MIDIYCRDRHRHPDCRCGECEALGTYADQRLDKCPYGEEKPTCADCSVHCYQPEMREQVKIVMRYAGPRMTWRHPFMALMHWIDGLRRRAPGVASRRRTLYDVGMRRPPLT